MTNKNTITNKGNNQHTRIFGGNKGILPERGKGPAPAPKPVKKDS